MLEDTCNDCGSVLLTDGEREHEWCDTCFVGVLLGGDLYG